MRNDRTPIWNAFFPRSPSLFPLYFFSLSASLSFFPSLLLWLFLGASLCSSFLCETDVLKKLTASSSSERMIEKRVPGSGHRSRARLPFGCLFLSLSLLYSSLTDSPSLLLLLSSRTGRQKEKVLLLPPSLCPSISLPTFQRPRAREFVLCFSWSLHSLLLSAGLIPRQDKKEKREESKALRSFFFSLSKALSLRIHPTTTSSFCLSVLALSLLFLKLSLPLLSSSSSSFSSRHVVAVAAAARERAKSSRRAICPLFALQCLDANLEGLERRLFFSFFCFIELSSRISLHSSYLCLAFFFSSLSSSSALLAIVAGDLLFGPRPF